MVYNKILDAIKNRKVAWQLEKEAKDARRYHEWKLDKRLRQDAQALKTEADRLEKEVAQEEVTSKT